MVPFHIILIHIDGAVYYNQSEGAGVFFFTSITGDCKTVRELA